MPCRVSSPNIGDDSLVISMRNNDPWSWICCVYCIAVYIKLWIGTLEDTTWRYHLKIPFEDTTWRYHLKIPLEDTTWRYHLKIPLEDTTWRYHLKISLEDITWRYHLKISLEDITWRYWVVYNLSLFFNISFCFYYYFAVLYFFIPELSTRSLEITTMIVSHGDSQTPLL